MAKFRVEVAYCFKRKKGGVVAGMTIEADDEESAIDKANALHIARYPDRVWLRTTAEKQ